jgi:hypothetical protein
MRKAISMMTFAALSEGGGASPQDDKIKRTLLFTLGANENVKFNKYFVLQQSNQNHFACLIRNEVKKSETFVFNGKRIAPGKWFNFLYLNMHEENGYVFEYCLGDLCYVNIKGMVYGPFDKDSLVFAKDSSGNIDYDKFYYSKTKGINCFYYLHYNNVKEGPFDRVLFPEETKKQIDCECFYLLDDKWYAHYSNGDNKIIPLFYCYSYKTNEGMCVNINGRNSRGYELFFIEYFNEDGNYAFIYQKYGKWYMNINGKESRNYDHFDDCFFTQNGSYAYTYEKDNEYYANVNGKDSRGYDEVSSLQLTESGKYAYIYKENEKYHVNVNGENSRGYEQAHLLHLIENGNYAYIYLEDRKWYVNINGKNKNSRGYDYVDMSLLRLTESGKYAYCYLENEKWYVNINGTIKNSREYDDNVIFICLTENGNYAYCYKENGKAYVNINIDGIEKISGSYHFINSFILTEEGNYSFYYYNDEGRVCKNDNGKDIETEYLSGMGWDEESNFCFFNKRGEATPSKIYSTDRKHSLCSLYEDKGDETVIVDGKSYGTALAMYAWYDRTKHAFIWNALEGKELVIYEYKL